MSCEDLNAYFRQLHFEGLLYSGKTTYDWGERKGEREGERNNSFGCCMYKALVQEQS